MIGLLSLHTCTVFFYKKGVVLLVIISLTINRCIPHFFDVLAFAKALQKEHRGLNKDRY
jgi:hypothetical protein